MPDEWDEEAGEAALQGDDFTRITGIGPVIKRQLYAAGIRTFRQLAVIAPEDIARLVKDLPLLSVERIMRQDWPGQARRLVTESASDTSAYDNLSNMDRGVRFEVTAITLGDRPGDHRPPFTNRRFQVRLYLRLCGPRAVQVAAERLWFTVLLLAWSHTTGAARVLASSRALLSAERLVYSITLDGILADANHYHLAGLAFLADEAIVGHASGIYVPGAWPPLAHCPTTPGHLVRIRGIMLDTPPGQPFLVTDQPVEAVIRFRVEPAPTQGATCLVCLLAHELSTGRTLILGTEGQELQAGRRDQAVAITCRTPGLARYWLIGAVLLPEKSLLDVAAGPPLRVARQER